MAHNLPDFPWDTLAPYGAIARNHASGIIDLSVGTPVDDTPQFIQDAFSAAANSPRYPLTAGTPELREAIANWAVNTLGATGDFGVLPLIGSKEFVAWLPTLLTAKSVIYPDIAYPTYLVGAKIAGAQPLPVGLNVSDWPAAEMAWINSPSNPTGRVHTPEDFQAAIAWSRAHQSLLVSDECYLEFGDSKTPTSVLQYTNGDNRNILAVHSLSKRSNMAGFRAAFVIGDPKLIQTLLEVRKHAGMIVPLPVQQAMIAALGDSAHVEVQRARYNARRSTLRPALEAAGFAIEHSEAGLYLWATRHEDCWKSVQWLADLGILATPGSFYGDSCNSYIRIAMTASDAQIADAAHRITAALA